MSRPVVTILGAGLAGLTLGQCLRQRGIAHIIYDRAKSTPRHTYGITLESWAYKSLLNVLDIDDATLRKHLAVDSPSGTGLVRTQDQSTHTPDSRPTEAFRVNRSKLETMLREGLNIKFEHSISSVKLLLENKKVELCFENGLRISPSIVVDTMGVHSPLRKSLLPDVELEVLPYAVYSGKRYVKRDEFESIYAPVFGTGNVVVRTPDEAGSARLEISVNENSSDGDISISYVYSRAAKSQGPDELHNPSRPNTKATEIPEAFYEEMSSSIANRVSENIFKKCFHVDTVRSDRVLHWLMRVTMVPKEELIHLAKFKIALTGDSVHAVPILGGHGANLAITDAEKLANSIGKGNDESQNLEDFYEQLWPAWNESVSLSKTTLAEMHRSEEPAPQEKL